MEKFKSFFKGVFTSDVAALSITLIRTIIGQTVKDKLVRAVLVAAIAGAGAYTGYVPLVNLAPAIVSDGPPAQAIKSEQK